MSCLAHHLLHPPKPPPNIPKQDQTNQSHNFEGHDITALELCFWRARCWAWGVWWSWHRIRSLYGAMRLRSLTWSMRVDEGRWGSMRVDEGWSLQKITENIAWECMRYGEILWEQLWTCNVPSESRWGTTGEALYYDINPVNWMSEPTADLTGRVLPRTQYPACASIRNPLDAARVMTCVDYSISIHLCQHVSAVKKKHQIQMRSTTQILGNPRPGSVVQDSLSLFEPVDGGAERACRGATSYDNQPTYFLVTSAVDLASCQLLLASF